MKSDFSRRDFLKLAGLTPLSLAAPSFIGALNPVHAAIGSKPNVLVVVFDAWSASNISLYGYGRETTPNLARLAKRAIVYHNHFAAGNFTTPGTASLLTGVYPWTHRAINNAGKVVSPWGRRSLFSVFQNYYRLAYSHNGWAYILLDQLKYGMQELLPVEKLFLGSNVLIAQFLAHDHDLATVGWARDMVLGDDGYAYSLFLSHLYGTLSPDNLESLRRLYPRGIPADIPGQRYLLEQAIDWVKDRISQIPQPFFIYFHMLPPHAPYHTSVEFYDRFLHDRYRPPFKPVDVFAPLEFPDLLTSRQEYDEFILYVDREFDRLYAGLKASGLLENTWVVLTSDHGEMFERGLAGHGGETLYQPLIHIPLLIFEPGRKVGIDIHIRTSAVDVLPTLAHVTGQAIPHWAEGAVLPPYRDDSPDPERSIYAVQAMDNPQDAALRIASTTLVKGRYKLLYFFGYGDRGIEDMVKLYDLEADPEELDDLSASQKGIADQMLTELKTKLAAVNRPYV